MYHLARRRFDPLSCYRSLNLGSIAFAVFNFEDAFNSYTPFMVDIFLFALEKVWLLQISSFLHLDIVTGK